MSEPECARCGHLLSWHLDGERCFDSCGCEGFRFYAEPFELREHPVTPEDLLAWGRGNSALAWADLHVIGWQREPEGTCMTWIDDQGHKRYVRGPVDMTLTQAIQQAMEGE